MHFRHQNLSCFLTLPPLTISFVSIIINFIIVQMVNNNLSVLGTIHGERVNIVHVNSNSPPLDVCDITVAEVWHDISSYTRMM